MNRRSLLAISGTALATWAGCLGSSNQQPPRSTPLPPDPDQRDGYPPSFETTPSAGDIDPASFETTEVEGISVPLAPIEAAYTWYRRRAARFVDARGSSSYRESHVYGAVLSPAPSGLEQNDPVAGWPTSERIVAYCGCPHHLSSLRAATLLSNGYEAVYVIDEGFWEWQARGYPLAGESVGSTPARHVIEGMTDPAFAGESAWVRHPASGQREAARIASDGTYRVELRFTAVTQDSTIVVETPGYRLAAPLGTLIDGIVTG